MIGLLSSNILRASVTFFNAMEAHAAEQADPIAKEVEFDKYTENDSDEDVNSEEEEKELLDL
jgi:hypothetical protein